MMKATTIQTRDAESEARWSFGETETWRVIDGAVGAPREPRRSR